jgi:tetratricopeptide (TPR) repeat protein
VQGYCLRASIRSDQGFADLAMADYDTALELDPEHAGAWGGKSHVLMENGDMAGAEAAILKAHELDPEALGPRLSLAHCRKVKEGDENLVALEDKAKEMADMSPIVRIPFHFALGKSYEDLKRYDEAMEHFIKGCALKRKRVQYSAENQAALVGNIQRIFTTQRVAQLSGSGAKSDVPIFVLGMPRSGTTLTETIIASHPLVYGAGELPDLLHLGAMPMGADDPGYPLNCATLTADRLMHLGETYVEQVRARAPEARHITDKMPANFQMLGLIHLMLPNAKIIHIKRNPVDTCVSNFTKLFNRSQFQSYDMTELGNYYRNYLDIMAHWRSVLPKDSFYEVQYEQLVANQEEETRKLIAYCGLEWDEACMTPHKTERSIKTASVTQVRQPVYTSSVERWRCYEKHLGPLLEALGDAVPP